jgi:hypothetical protein
MSGNQSINVLKFWSDYTPDGVDAEGKPKMKAVDMVAYAPIGKSNMQLVKDAVVRLGKLQPLNPDNPASVMAHARWAQIKSAYDAWKSGNEVPLNGTPLAAWPGVSSEQAAALKMMGVRTVEEVRDASESIVVRFPFPHAREMQKAAGLFLMNFDKDKTARDMVALQSANAEKDAQLEEMRQMILEMQANQAKAAKAPKDKVAA